jgi:hypothetical protein
MAVIIDTFEVISETESATPSASSNNNAQTAGSATKPTDIEAVLEYQYLRNNRLRAH